MMLQIEKYKETIRKLLEFNEFDNAAGHKINIQKIIAFLFTRKQQKENLKKQLQGGKRLYSENFKTLIKEVAHHINRKIYCVLGLEESILLK